MEHLRNRLANLKKTSTKDFDYETVYLLLDLLEKLHTYFNRDWVVKPTGTKYINQTPPEQMPNNYQGRHKSGGAYFTIWIDDDFGLMMNLYYDYASIMSLHPSHSHKQQSFWMMDIDKYPKGHEENILKDAREFINNKTGL